jgi:ribosome-binding protein aMBF1 (putative translation factor)
MIQSGRLTMANELKQPIISARELMASRIYNGQPDRIAEREHTAREMSLGAKLRKMREDVGMTQSQLAKNIGTQASAISRLEDADYDGHSMGTLEKVAKALGMRLVIDFEAMPKRAKARSVKVS